MRYSEDHFSYYNRSARPPIVRIRATLQSWFDHYPNQHQTELYQRFRSDFDAAFYELFLHELLRCLGYTVQVHPILDLKAARQPDFLATSSTGSRFVLEATLARDESEDKAARRKVEEVLLDSINALHSENFMLDVKVYLVTTQAPSGRAIREFLARELAALDPDDIARRYASEGGWEALPKLVYATDNVHLVFRPIPVRAEKRGKVERPIGGLGPGEPVKINPMLALRRAVRRKASGYGKLGIPYVVAVNALAEYGPHSTDLIEALFGTVDLHFFRNPSGVGSSSRWVRSPNGAWFGPTGPHNTRVSAVLYSLPAIPWNLGSVPSLLIRNPWARYPDTSELGSLPKAQIDDSGLVWLEGTSTGQILGLPEGWPNVEQDDID